MPLRTSEAAVKAIIETDDDLDITPFMEVANFMVTKVCSDSGYSDAQMELIERWLSAHFYAVEDPRATIETADDVTAHYESKVALGLDITRYGQQAMRIDTDGNLAALNNAMKKVVKPLPAGSIKSKIVWLGK